MQRFRERSTQTEIDDYFSVAFEEHVTSLKSKRLAKAVANIMGRGRAEEEAKKQAKHGRRSPRKPRTKKAGGTKGRKKRSSKRAIAGSSSSSSPERSARFSQPGQDPALQRSSGGRRKAPSVDRGGVAPSTSVTVAATRPVAVPVGGGFLPVLDSTASGGATDARHRSGGRDGGGSDSLSSLELGDDAFDVFSDDGSSSAASSSSSARRAKAAVASYAADLFDAAERPPSPLPWPPEELPPDAEADAAAARLPPSRLTEEEVMKVHQAMQDRAPAVTLRNFDWPISEYRRGHAFCRVGEVPFYEQVCVRARARVCVCVCDTFPGASAIRILPLAPVSPHGTASHCTRPALICRNVPVAAVVN